MTMTINNCNRESISKDGVKVLAVNVKNGEHKELLFDFKCMHFYKEMGWLIYAVNKEGVFFFTDNEDGEGFSWCKVRMLE